MTKPYEWNWMKTYAQDHVICPYCGYVHDNSDVFTGEEGEAQPFECEDCGKEFDYVRGVTIDYTTTPKKEEPAEITQQAAMVKEWKPNSDSRFITDEQIGKAIKGGC